MKKMYHLGCKLETSFLFAFLQGVARLEFTYKWMHVGRNYDHIFGKNVHSFINTRTGGGSENHTVWRGAYNAPHRSQLL